MNMTMFLLAIAAFAFSTKSVSSRKCVEEILYCGDPVSGIFKIGNFSCCYNAEHAGALKFLSGKLYICLGNKWATFEFEKLFDYGTEFNSGYSCKDIQGRAQKRLSDGIYWIRLRGKKRLVNLLLKIPLFWWIITKPSTNHFFFCIHIIFCLFVSFSSFYFFFFRGTNYLSSVLRHGWWRWVVVLLVPE